MKNLFQLRTTPEQPSSNLALRPPLVAFLADAESEGVLRECLSQLSVQNTIVMRGAIGKAIQYLSEERSPNVLVVDISGVDLPISEIHKLAEVCEPGVTVIVLGDRNDIGLYRDLLQAGITDYIVKPLTPYLVAKSVQAAIEGQRAARISEKQAKLVAFVGTRGGVGSTTLAVNLAWYLANKQNRRIALLDLDLHNGDTGLMLNLKPTSGLREALENPIRVDSIFVERAMAMHGERLFVLGAEESLHDDLNISVDGIEALISVLRAQFHYLIVDVPRVATPAFRKVLSMADVRVIVADQTLRSVRDAVRIREMIGVGDADHRNVMVINRSGEGGRDSLTLEELGDALEVRPKVVIPFQPKVFGAASGGGQVPAATEGKFTESIEGLAAEISGRTPERRRDWRFWK
ncbi:MAG TPA: AAA family ATPase [Stellaceae bacterium]|nr:AAA family ATPase [Stellaceae bacterium]